MIQSLMEIKNNIAYCPDTGRFDRLVSYRVCDKLGEIKNTPQSHGYIVISVKGIIWRAHRLAWYMQTGEPPSVEVDHINGIRIDNRFSNLRLATKIQNNYNRLSKGFWFVASLKKWRAGITVNGKKIHLGLFATSNEAGAAYIIACEKHQDSDFISRKKEFAEKAGAVV